MHRTVAVELSVGDLADRVTIMELKAARAEDPGRRAMFAGELARLRVSLPGGTDLGALRNLNALLWDAEDAIRHLITANDFGEKFVDLARRIPALNDARAKARAAIDGVDVCDKVYSVS